LIVASVWADPPAQPAAPTSSVSAAADVPSDCEGFWPTKKMMNGMIRRWASEAADHYDLTPDQHKQLEAMMLERWPKFIEDNRRVMQPLINQFFEATVDPEPPSAEAVADWADRAMPLFERFRESIKEGNTQVREILTPKQQAKFDLDALGLAAGMQMAETQLKSWQRGEFDPQDWGDRRRRERERQRRRAEEERDRALAAERAASRPSLADEVLVELDAWDKYVADFIAMYHLDDGQRSSAESILTELKSRAQDIRAHAKERLDEIQQQLSTHTDPDAKKKLTDELVSIYQPIDTIFAELKKRLEALPTAAQRAVAQPAENPK
jgi:Spy/CpxP family protein refolding chaperone